ncbi:hypothetical protein HY950_00785 [Candidatus Gottesmanbacteria bacterium]|nr:hypothetical protein [Candidatus Gottesmanbacteria bacterium]
MRNVRRQWKREKSVFIMNAKRRNQQYSKADRLWGGDGPYSEAHLIVETRILDDRVSRIFIVVEVSINPYTYECIRAHRTLFKSDEMIQQLLDHSEYRGQPDGYVSMAFIDEYRDSEVMEMAQEAIGRCKDTIIKMHKFVMQQLNKERAKN